MTNKDYKKILDFFGEEQVVMCCLRKKVGKEAFDYLFRNVNPEHLYYDSLADVSQKGKLFFMKKSPKSKPNCLLIKVNHYPLRISARGSISLTKEQVIEMMHNKEVTIEAKKEVRNKKFPSINSLRKLSYDDFLKTDYWKEVRQAKLRECGHKCQICGAKHDLHIHHNCYDHHGQEHKHLEDLVVLCKDCHTLFHQKLKIANEK